MIFLEKTIAYSPPLVYSKIDGIKSIDGTEAEGWIITVGGTPKQMMSREPEFTYKRLIAAISGVNGVYKQKDIDKIRDLALKARANNK